MNYEIFNMDCRDVMDLYLPDNSVDSVVTDPPYGLGFMGKEWDHGVPGVEFWRRTYEVLKPGGHLLAFSGSRTYHRMVCAIEDAGFEIRDQIMWVYGSGFPKSHNGEWGGTALKPAHEPIVFARKPLIGTVATNWETYGTGALNIDGCRVPGAAEATRFDPKKHGHEGWRMNATDADCAANASALGRWPANLIHDGSDEVLAGFPQSNSQQGDLVGHAKTRGNGIYGDMPPARDAIARVEPETSAARFFYCAKASKKDRNEGCEALPLHQPTHGKGHESGGLSVSGSVIPNNNNHPTVKPTDLMAYLCRLVTPAGGVVFDPFMGSGSTGKAALREGFRFIGCEKETAYSVIAEARLKVAV